MGKQSVVARFREAVDRWSAALSVAGVAAVCEIASRIGIPGVNGNAVHDFINAGHGGLIWLYDFIGGGGVSRGSVLALGVLPYLSARIYLWLGRSLSTSIRRRTDDENTASKVVRAMVLGFASIQAFGYMTLLMTIPNAVTSPGLGFVTRTVLLLTGSAVVESLLLEKMLRRRESDEQTTATRESMPDASTADSKLRSDAETQPLLSPNGELAKFTSRETKVPA
jgi:preprotein translocase subunit SecY